MCIVIDINTLHLVFTGAETDFTPVRDWIIHDKGKVVIGGSKFSAELLRAGKYLKIFGELKKRRKLVSIDNEKVNLKEEEIKHNVPAKCNDAHIIAIISVSGCKLVCSVDSSSYPFLKQRNLYPTGGVPKIYSRKGNSDLLNDQNIADCCKPTVSYSRRQSHNIMDMINPQLS